MHKAQDNAGRYGHFGDVRASYVIERLNLPTAWDYIYKNEKLLLRVDQHGPVKAQIDPPGGIELFRREYLQRYSSWLVWLTSEALGKGGFTNFYRPAPGESDPGAEPEVYQAEFQPSEAIYTVEHEGVRCKTIFWVRPGEATVCMEVEVTNLRGEGIELNVMPVMRTYVNPAQMAPWDKPEWYLRTNFFREECVGFMTQLLNMQAQPDQRKYVTLISEGRGLAGAEVFYEKFAGQGTFENPEAVYGGALRLRPEDARPWGVCEEVNTAYCYPPVNALHYKIKLVRGGEWRLCQVLSLLDNGPDGSAPAVAEMERAAELLGEEARRDAKKVLAEKLDTLITRRKVRTGDVEFDRYVNEWLPVQQDWVCSLDRGWPSGMRGTRDSANDFTAQIAIDSAQSRKILCKVMECQRTDGWFPRQYSVEGRKGRHDLRGHVDGGCWVVELLYEYLCRTRDFAVLGEPLAWLDSDEESSVLGHAVRAVEFFVARENLGEHGLCKIGEGDWNDAVNMAGQQGRGESVMVSCQTVIALWQLGAVLGLAGGKYGVNDTAGLRGRFQKAGERLTENLRKHAYNGEGYFNSVFNDAGQWIFSPADPDGQRRVSGPCNWYAISSGVAGPERIESILKELDYLRCEQGYRLFYPPMGVTPMEKVGRVASGDQSVGMFENGTAYNQGSHGFLARALATAGKGDLLYEVIGCLLPYDQQWHPTQATLTAPYAVVNCWQRVPGYRGRGGMTFLTGSIALALRAVYDWMLGIRPRLEGLAIDPCLPAALHQVSAEFEHLGRKVHLQIVNQGQAGVGVERMTVNGKVVERVESDEFSGRKLFIADDEYFGDMSKGSNKIVVEMK